MNNLKNILKIYALERDLNPDDLALLNTLRALTESEREVMVEALRPGKAKGGASATSATAKRKIEHCGVCDFTRRAAHHKDVNRKDYHEFHSRTERLGKSARAQGLAQAVRGRLQQREPVVGGFADDTPEHCATCTQFADANIHHLTSDPNYHPFVSPPSAHAADGRSSSRNGSPGTSIASLSAETESVSGVAGG